MFFEKHTLPDHFKKWVWYNRENKIILLFALLAILVQYFIFIRLYPFPNFLPDSYSYIETAVNNYRVNMWPVGYSNFLRLISVFNYTSAFLFFVQYILLQLSIMFFVFTICYFFKANKWVIRSIIFLSVINPFLLYVSNFVSSDALFASLSLLWLTTLFWIMYSQGRMLVLIHGLILFYVFSIRYNALYYPIISVGVIAFIHVQLKEKLLLLLFTLIPVIYFIGNTTYQYQRKTKVAQFSPFGGWQLAANAMYMYAHVSPKTKEPVPKEFEKLHAITVKQMDSLNHVKPQNRPDNELGIYYLWNDSSPLRLYFVDHYKKSKDSSLPYLNQWAKISPLYSRYGTWLIKQYPIEFAKYYLIPNFMNYYTPSPEFLGVYNMGSDSIDIQGKEWFHYKTRKVRGYSKDKLISLTKVFPILLALVNILLFTSFIGFVFLNGYRNIDLISKKILSLIMVVWCFNLLFSVTASPIVLRYQVFPFVFTLTMGFVLIAYLIIESLRDSNKEKIIVHNEIGSVEVSVSNYK